MNLKILSISGIFLLFIFIYSLQSDIDLMRTREGLWQNLVLMPGEIINEFVLSGFSGLAADMLWIEADEYWHKGEWQRAFPLYRTVTWLQPNFIDAWSIGGWHLAYNMYAYTKDPELLFLDEPTIGLDPLGSVEMKSLFSRLKSQGKTILLSSHLLSEVEKSCDRVGILYNGRLVKIGGIQDLLSVHDEVQITTERLTDAAKKNIERIVEADGSRVLKFDHPRESLESFFLRVIVDKKKEGLV